MKKSKAQQLVEFLFVAPFIIIIFGILTEYAYALNVNMTLNEGLKDVTASIYSQIKPGMSADDINNLIVTPGLIQYLQSNNAPIGMENNLKVSYSIGADEAVFIANYTYFSAFTLPNMYINFLPPKFNFSAVAMVPAAFLKPNNYEDTYSISLDGIWASDANFTSMISFQFFEKGILKKTTGTSDAQTKSLVFLIPGLVPVPVPTDATNIPHNIYKITGWDGMAKMQDGFPIYFCLEDGFVYKYDSGTASVTQLASPNITFLAFLNSQFPSATNIIFYSQPVADETAWKTGCTSGTALSDTSQVCPLKLAVAVRDSSNSGNLGNYDNISNTAGLSSFTAYPYGSFVVMSPAALGNLAAQLQALPIPNEDWK